MTKKARGVRNKVTLSMKDMSRQTHSQIRDHQYEDYNKLHVRDFARSLEARQIDESDVKRLRRNMAPRSVAR